MKLRLFTAFILAALCTLAPPATRSQPPLPLAGPRMFANESLVYEAKVNKLRLNWAVAELKFDTSVDENRNELTIRSEAVSKGTLLKLFSYSFLQQYRSTTGIDTFVIRRTTKHDVQKERVRDSEAIFDYEDKRVRWLETDPKEPARPPRSVASEITPDMHDVISAIYAIRLMPLRVGDRVELSVSDSGLVYKLPVVVTKREQQKTILGKVWCLRVEPQIFGPGRLIEQNGKMVIWFVDDARKVPVRSELKTPYGKFTIKLKSAAGVSAN